MHLHHSPNGVSLSFIPSYFCTHTRAQFHKTYRNKNVCKPVKFASWQKTHLCFNVLNQMRTKKQLGKMWSISFFWERKNVRLQWKISHQVYHITEWFFKANSLYPAHTRNCVKSRFPQAWAWWEFSTFLPPSPSFSLSRFKRRSSFSFVLVCFTCIVHAANCNCWVCLWRSASLVYGTICNTKITRLKCNFLAQFYTSTHRLSNRWSSFTTFPLTFIAFFANYTNNYNNSNGVGADAIHVHVPLFQKLKLFWSMKCEYLWYRLTLVKFPIWIFLLSILCAIYSFACSIVNFPTLCIDFLWIKRLCSFRYLY